MTSLPRLNIAHIVPDEHGAIFAELIELLTDCLQQLGTCVEHTVNTIRPGALNILIGPMVFLKPGAFAANDRSLPPYIVFQSEVLDEGQGFISRHPAYLELLRGAAQIWDYSRANLPFLAARGYGDVHYVPLGYSNRLERIMPAAARDIDVYFCGSTTPRRKEVLDDLDRRGFRVLRQFGSYGPTRDSLIARSRIIVNVHQFETTQLEQVRLSYLLNNRCFIVSETAADADLYSGGVAFCSYTELADRCAWFLRAGMEAERERIAGVGYGALKLIPMVQSIRSALERFTG